MMQKTTKEPTKIKKKTDISFVFILIVGTLLAVSALNYFDVLSNGSSSPSNHGNAPGTFSKPVIYLYPESPQEIFVGLQYQGELIADYPAYNQSIGGWNVKASPHGDLVDTADGKEYSYIFWEGVTHKSVDWNLETGFVVPGRETRDFLQEILPKTGMTPREYNEFIVYWYPLLQNNPYNLIHFANQQYTDTAPLTTIPQYDSLLRVFMVVKPLNELVEIEAQEFDIFEREGFTVVEWGGILLDK